MRHWGRDSSGEMITFPSAPKVVVTGDDQIILDEALGKGPKCTNDRLPPCPESDEIGATARLCDKVLGKGPRWKDGHLPQCPRK